MDYLAWMQKAKENLQKVSIDSAFFVKDLFKGTEWNQLSKGEKSGFGRYFKNEVSGHKLKNVEYIGKAANNSAQYIKTNGGEQK